MRRGPLRMSAMVVSLLCLATCADESAGGTKRSDGDKDGDGRGPGGGDTRGSGGEICPASVPGAAATCPRLDLVCQYGEDPRIACRPLATCTQGGWSIDDPGCDPPAVETCPESREAAAGQACSVPDAYCTYNDLICHCTNCSEGPVVGCGGPFTWRCDAPHPDPQCPEARPNLGETCDDEGRLCQYRCGSGGARACSGGVWVSADGTPCPVSTRSAKGDVVYLSPEEIEEVAEALMAIRLARFQYVDPARRGREHLGFIIEDSPGIPAVDAKRQMVDLYGYASMLLAAIQAQAQRIETLEEELRARRAVPEPAWVCE